MAKTYLQLVNAVLTRLKDDTVSSVDETPESLLIGEFVNEAKEWVEDNHDWTSLRTTIQVQLASAGDFTGSLTGAGSRSKIIQVINDTTDYEFCDAEDYRRMNVLLTDNDQENGEPERWDINGIDSNGDPIVNFYPKADQAYDINFNMSVPQDVLTSDSTELTVPHMPVILYAWALAIEERGEDGGTGAQSAKERAEAALHRLVDLDKTTTFNEYVWEIE